MQGEDEAEDEEERASPTESTALERAPEVPSYFRNVPIHRLIHPSDRRILPGILLSAVFVVGGLAFGLPLMAALTIVLLVVTAIRMVIAAICTCRVGHGCAGCTYFLSATDAFWLHDSYFNQYVAHCLFFVESGLDVTATREILLSRIIERTTETGERVFARFSQKVMSVAAGYCWVNDSEFDIEKHVFEETRCIRTRHQLRNLMASLMGHEPLPRNRPLWEIRLVKNFGCAGDTVLIARVHHALSDGVALVKILGSCLADRPQTLRGKPRWGGETFPLNAFRAAVIGPLTLLTWLCRRSDFNPLKHRQPLTGKRVVGWSMGIRLATVDRIRQVTHCTVNDVLMAAARGAIRDYFKYQCGLTSPPNVTVNIPVDLRFEPSTPETLPDLGTGFATVSARLPTNAEGAIPGLWETRRCMEQLKNSADAVVMYGSLHYLLAALPVRLAQWLLRSIMKAATLSFNSLAGPERALTLASRRLKSVAVWTDAHPEVPLAFCVFSYAGGFHVAVSADSGTVPSPARLLKSFVAHIERMYSIVAKRKVPGLEKRRSSFSAERRWEQLVKPSVAEMNDRLQAVQAELHEISRKLELVSLTDDSKKQWTLYRESLTRRKEELKEEFVELITELRKRRSLLLASATMYAAPAGPMSTENAHYDHDMDGQLRRPHRRFASSSDQQLSSQPSRRPSLYALGALLSTSRPLLTQYGPRRQMTTSTSTYHGVPTEDLERNYTPEQVSPLLFRPICQESPELTRQDIPGVSYRRDIVY